MGNEKTSAIDALLLWFEKQIENGIVANVWLTLKVILLLQLMFFRTCCLHAQCFSVVQSTAVLVNISSLARRFLETYSKKPSLKFVHLCSHNKRQFFQEPGTFRRFYSCPLDAVVYRRDLNCFLKTYKKHISWVRSSTSRSKANTESSSSYRYTYKWWLFQVSLGRVEASKHRELQHVNKKKLNRTKMKPECLRRCT